MYGAMYRAYAQCTGFDFHEAPVRRMSLEELLAAYWDQWMYQIGQYCDSGCRASRVSFPFPNFVLNNQWTATAGAAVAGCTHYSPAAGVQSNITDIWFSTTTSLPCQATWVDGSSYNFVSVSAAASVNETLFLEPVDCTCSDQIDLVIMVDRSGSLAYTDYDDARRFAREYALKFDISPALTNVAIGQFDTTYTVYMNLTQGNTPANVDAAINAMTCTCSDTLVPQANASWDEDFPTSVATGSPAAAAAPPFRPRCSAPRRSSTAAAPTPPPSSSSSPTGATIPGVTARRSTTRRLRRRTSSRRSTRSRRRTPA